MTGHDPRQGELDLDVHGDERPPSRCRRDDCAGARCLDCLRWDHAERWWNAVRDAICGDYVVALDTGTARPIDPDGREHPDERRWCGALGAAAAIANAHACDRDRLNPSCQRTPLEVDGGPVHGGRLQGRLYWWRADHRQHQQCGVLAGDLTAGMAYLERHGWLTRTQHPGGHTNYTLVLPASALADMWPDLAELDTRDPEERP